MSVGCQGTLSQTAYAVNVFASFHALLTSPHRFAEVLLQQYL